MQVPLLRFHGVAGSNFEIALMHVRNLLLDVRDRLARVKVLWARLGAIHDRVAAVELESIVERLREIKTIQNMHTVGRRV